MQIYGEKWCRALKSVLKRLALDEGYGFLVLIGPDGCGKTDLIRLVIKITESSSASDGLRDDDLRKLARLVYQRKYIVVSLKEDTHFSPNIPMRMLNHIFETVSHVPVAAGQRFLLTWDDIDSQLDDSVPYHGLNQAFLDEMHRPLALYKYVTFLVSATHPPGAEGGFLKVSGGPKHFLNLVDSTSPDEE